MNTVNIQLLAEKSSELANYITSLHFEHDPDLIKRYGELGKHRCHEDATFHLNFLIEAMTLNHPDMYSNYIVWAAAMLKSRNIPESDLYQNLNFVQLAIHEILGTEFSFETKKFVDAAKEKLKSNSGDDLSFITNDNPLEKEVTAYLGYLLQGKRGEATHLVNSLIKQNTPIIDIYQHIFQISQYEVGRLWQCNKITVAHEHYCTAATQQIMSGLYQTIFSTARVGKTLVACSIAGDLHEMGIRMVTDIFEMGGWDTYYLGASMPDPQLLESLIEYKADVLALSVTLPTHVSKAAYLIKKIRSISELSNLKVMVGGYPFITNHGLWNKIGANAYAQNANQAVLTANELVNQ
ncbi:B12-binding domain-containing protein [Algoriphagus sp.]|uniref:cobalamin B12-binding domain-containing protein n=1 Tax=Algoriphagus sp. TaxID=1872435 RepID=UPI00391B5E0C